MKRFFLKLTILGTAVLGTYFFLSASTSTDFSIFITRVKLKKMELGENYKTIIIGDSRALAMNQLAEPETFNYAMTSWNGMYPYSYILERYLQSNKPPKTLILSMVPETFFATKDYDITSRSEVLFPVTLSQRWEQYRQDPKETIKRLKAKYMIGNIFEPAIDRTLLDQKTGFAIFNRYRRFEPDPRWNFLELRDQIGPWTPSKLALSQFDDFVELTRRKNIRLVLYFMPIPEEFHRKHANFFSLVETIIKDLRKKHPDILILDPYPPEDLYPFELFVDGSHLNLEGAERFNKTRFPQLMRAISKD